MRRLALLLIAGLVGFGVRAPAAAPGRIVGAAKSPPAQVYEEPGKPAKSKSTLAKPGQNKQATAALAKNKPPPGMAAAHQQITVPDICRTVAQAAAENQLPVDFLVRVIWQESRFNPRAVSHRGAEGIAQFMRQTASFRGLGDPFEPISAIESAARYLDDLRKRFGNLGLAAAGYNAGPGRVREWLDGRGRLPKETRNYVAIITGWTADEWASPLPPKVAKTAIPQGVPCASIARLLLAPLPQEWHIAACVRPWDSQFIANWSKTRVWQFAALIADRVPIMPQTRFGNLGLAKACYTAASAQGPEWSGRRGALISIGWTGNQMAESSISQGASFASVAHLVSAPPEEARRLVACRPLWGAQLTANWSEAGAWAAYRMLQKQFAALIGDREPIVLHGSFPGMGAAPRYMIRIVDDSREKLERLCDALVAAGGACVVLRNELSVPNSPSVPMSPSVPTSPSLLMSTPTGKGSG